MNHDVMSIVKKGVKAAGVTCVAAGAVALVTSGAALKAITEGSKYLAKTVKDIIEEKPEQEKKVVAEEVTIAEETVPTVEVPVAEETV